MDAGPSLYRRHRPRVFADVVGQAHVVRTLRNAVESGHVHHAYLFVGSRGTGKTSMAKMLAACLNCAEGPTIEPCGRCESCLAIAAATSLDVIEMDAASNNSVDDIRELRDSVRFAPVSGRSKVYILDEAHMLTNAAWNAFLKTLEEPPPNTVFVLATTEAHKVLPTVVDRCHRFDFRRPTVQQLATVVARVAEKEQITITPEAVILVARGATGSYRDALGTLEQLITYAGRSIVGGDVMAVLGITGDELLFDAVDAVIDHDAAAGWHVAARLAETGRDPRTFLGDLEKHARDVLITQTLGAVPPQLAMLPERDARLLAQAERAGGADIVRLLDLLASASRMSKDGADPQIQLELAIARSASPQLEATTRALLTRIERIERTFDNGDRTSPPAPLPLAAPQAVSPQPEPVPQTTPPPLPASSEVQQTTPGTELSLAFIIDLWPSVVAATTNKRQYIGSALTAARPLALADGTLTVAFPADQIFSKRQIQSPEISDLIGSVIRELTGTNIRLECVTDDEPGPQTTVEPIDEDQFIRLLRTEFDAVETELDGPPQTPPPGTA